MFGTSFTTFKAKQDLWLYNTHKVSLVFDATLKEMLSSNIEVDFIHKTEFKNKLRRLRYSTNANPTGNPVLSVGCIEEVGGEYELFIPKSIQHHDWLGVWSICIGSSDVTLQLKNYIKFVEPNLPGTPMHLRITLSLIDGEIVVGFNYFILNISELDGKDILA